MLSKVINGDKIYYINDTTFIYIKDDRRKTGYSKCFGKIKNCKYCGDLFFTKRKGQKFCNKSCASKYRMENIDVSGKNNPNYGNGDKIYGKLNPNYKGGKIIVVCDFCGKLFKKHKSQITEMNFCNLQCFGEYNKLHKLNDKNPNWKGGISTLYELYRSSEKYSDWRISCMARDDFTCQECGKKRGMLNVHHIKTVKDIFNEYEIKTRDDYMNCDELWDLDNGITLCKECHRNIHRGVNND